MPDPAAPAAERAEPSSGGQEQEQEQQQQPAAKSKPAKRNVALHVGYVGTHYVGLQANRDLAHLPTVEAELEKAILKAGLLSAANFGDFRKSKWTRSSRTDKGVHSLATVIGVRLLVGDEHERDPEGVGLASAINAHLPDDVRVFAVQRTNKSFNARRWCGTRTYEYYLPASALGLDTPDASSAADAARLEQLRRCLAAYQGYRPFHCFAGNRSQYVGQRAKAAARKERRKARKAAEEAGEGGAEPGTSASGSSAAAAAAAAPDSNAAAAAADAVDTAADAGGREPLDSDEPDEGEGEGEDTQAPYASLGIDAYSGEGPVPPELRWRQGTKFLSEPDPSDPVVRSHYRFIRSFTADDPRPLVPGGVPCLRLEVTGDSFMLHQIRHMIGAAVAVVRGVMPEPLLEVALSAPGRVMLPRAPPHTLLLSSSAFNAFPPGWGLETPLVAKYTGERLSLREGGQQLLREFRHETFDYALNELLQHPDWAVWSRQVLPRYLYAEDDVAPVVQLHATWSAELKAKRAAEAAAKAAAAEAEAQAQAAAEAEAQAAAAEAAVAAAADGGGGGGGRRRGCCVQ